MMRKIRTTFFVLLISVFAIVAFLGIRTVISGIGDLTGQGCDTSLCCQDCETLSVTRVIDGDTFDSDEGRVRLFGVDTPERGEPCFQEATERLRALAGNTVRVEAGPRAKDPFGRSLYYIYTEAGESIDEALVREGLGVAWTQDGQHRDTLLGLEREARDDGTGCLW